MSINATATLTLQISGGPAVSVSWQLDAEVIDRATVKIPKKSTKHEVQLQPGAGDKILLFLMDRANDEVPDAVTYKLESSGADFKLSVPQIISGGDLLNELSKKPHTITFKNTGNDDVTVELLVIRKA